MAGAGTGAACRLGVIVSFHRFMVSEKPIHRLRQRRWQAEAPAPLEPTWGRRFRLPTEFPTMRRHDLWWATRPMDAPLKSHAN